MKQIVIGIVAFLGNYTGLSQTNAGADSLNKGKSGVAVPVERAAAKIYPNPAKSRAELEVKGFEPGFVQLLIIDANGIIYRDDKRILITGNEIIMVMFSLQPGLYFVLLKQKEKSVRKRLLIE